MSRNLSSLENLSKDRDNNLNLIRMLAATMVLFSHSYVVCSGDPHSEPWVGLLGMTPGGVAVDAFFVLSGFLVTGSLQRSNTLQSFSLARAAPIYPGLWIALAISTAVIGMGFTDLGFFAFMTEPQTWRYLAKNATMAFGAEAYLPGAFMKNPVSNHINASLWTLRWELRLYIVLGVIWWCTSLQRDDTRRRKTMAVLAIASAAALLALTLTLAGLGKSNDAPRLGAMFFSGTAYWMYRNVVRLRGNIALSMCVVDVRRNGSWRNDIAARIRIGVQIFLPLRIDVLRFHSWRRESCQSRNPCI